jgi:uncharacterized delta-60 repeat protein
MKYKKVLVICLLIAIMVLLGITKFIPLQSVSAEQGEKNGFLVIFLYQQGQWQPLETLTYDKILSEQHIDLSSYFSSETQVTLRIQHIGKTAAHIDAALLDGVAPQMVYGAEEDTTLALHKLSKVDYDLINARAKTLTLVYAKLKGQSAVFSLTARIEPDEISQIPFQYPLANLFQEMTTNSYFYTYHWDDHPGSLTIDGNLNDEGLGTPFFKEFNKTGSGHPDGYTYGWIFNDNQNLYVAIDFTSDNTIDGNKDYAKVFVNISSGLKEFKVSVPDYEWGKPGFIYTPWVTYQHKVYEFIIPLKELGITEIVKGEPLSLAFAAYGTATPLPGAFPGPLDPTFGIGGLRDHDLGYSSESIADIFPLPNGKLLAFGDSHYPDYDLILVRYNINGGKDISFGPDGAGVVTTTFSTSTFEVASVLDVQNDNKIVIAGYVDTDFALARFYANGTPDLTFGINGRVVTDLGSSEELHGMGIQSDQKIVAAGRSLGSMALARYTITGTLDTTFGTDGVVQTDINPSSNDEVYGLAIQPDGMIVVGGQSAADFILARYTITGTLDPTFGTNGIVISDLGGFESAAALALQENGKILMGGSTNLGASNFDFILARYTITGTLDTSFGTNGFVTTDFSPSPYIDPSYDRAKDLIIQPDGKIIEAGTSGVYYAMVRYNPDGSLDTTFGTGGKINTLDAPFQGNANSITIQNGGKIVLAGDHYVGSGNYNFGLVRYKGLEFYLPVIIR